MADFNGVKRNFTGGEVSRSILSRDDLAKFGSSCVVMRNFQAQVHGDARYRDGFRFVGQALGEAVLHTFQFNTDEEDMYVLVFTDSKIQFVQGDGFVVSPSGARVSINTPYTQDDLRDIRTVGYGDTVFVAHPRFPIHKLQRQSHISWTLEPELLSTPKTSLAGSSVNQKPSGSFNQNYKFTNVLPDGSEYGASDVFTVASTKPPGDWVVGDAIIITAPTPTDSEGHINVYKDKGGLFGFVGSTIPGNNGFTDNNYDPNTGDPPPESGTPFPPDTGPATGPTPPITTISIPNSVEYNGDGTRLFILDHTANNIKEYTTVDGFPWSLATEGPPTTFSIAAVTTFGRIMRFSNDGTKMFIASENSSQTTIHRWDLTTPWDLTTATHVQNSSVLSNNRMVGFDISTDGTVAYIVNLHTSPAKLEQYNMSTAFDITTISTPAFSINAPSTHATGFRIFDEGKRVILIDNQTQNIHILYLSTPWEVSSNSVTDPEKPAEMEGLSDARDIFIAPDQKRVVALGHDTAASYRQLDLRTKGDVVVNFPKALTIHNQRLWFGGSVVNPNTIYATDVGAFDSFKTSSPRRADDSLELQLFSTAQIQWLAGFDELLIGTSNEEFQVTVENNEYQADSQSHWGSQDIQPIIVGNSLLHIQRQGSTVRDLFYSLESSGYESNDLSILASHLFTGHTLTEWVFQQTPSSVVWAVRDDGNLAAMTYLKEHQIWGWHEHTTQGNFESIAQVGGDLEDRVYVSVKRNINGTDVWYIEKKEQEWNSTIPLEDAFFVDSGLVFEDTNQPNTAAPVDIKFRGNGAVAYVLRSDDNTIRQYALTEPWDVSTAQYTGKTYTDPIHAGALGVFDISPDGTRMYAINTLTNFVHQYSLPTPWDISTATFVRTQTWAPEPIAARSLKFSPTGERFLIMDVVQRRCVQYEMSTPWDISTMVKSDHVLSVSAQDNNPLGLDFNTGGSSLYVLGQTTDTIYRYNLPNAFSVEGATYANDSLSVTGQDDQPTAIATDQEQKTLYAIGDTTTAVYQYQGTVEDDLSTVQYTGKSFSLRSVTTVTGANHLAGETVSVLADGVPFTGLEVSAGGEFTLPVYAEKIVYGLPYEGLLAPLTFEMETQQGSTQGLLRNFGQVKIRVADSYGGSVGTSPVDADESSITFDPLEYDPINHDAQIGTFSGIVVTNATRGFSTDSTIFIKHDQPTPLNILSIIAEVKLG